jgi:16S rRNA (cytosine1402-N4)-methyltransferase
MGPRRRGGIDPATRTFQALRIAVNGEMEALSALLADGVERLDPAGRAAVISYHSLEDRAVKHAFRQRASTGPGPQFRILTPKPVCPSAEERSRNRRARSAKLRVLERTC